MVGVKHIQIRRIDLNLNVEASQDGDELRIWMSNDATRSNTFEEHKAVIRKCEASAVSKHFLPRVGVKLDNVNWVYENRDTMGYKGTAEVELRIGLAVAFKRGPMGNGHCDTKTFMLVFPIKGKNSLIFMPLKWV